MKPKTRTQKSVLPGASFTPSKEIPNTVQHENSDELATFRPCLPLAEILANFIASKSKNKKNSGENESSHLQDFATVARFIIEQKSFCQSDWYSLSRYLDTQISALIPLIHEFVTELVRCKRCRVVKGAYDHEIFEII